MKAYEKKYIDKLTNKVLEQNLKHYKDLVYLNEL